MVTETFVIHRVCAYRNCQSAFEINLHSVEAVGVEEYVKVHPWGSN